MEEKVEEVKVEKKSSNKVLVVIIVILLLIIMFGLGYFMGGGNLNSDGKEEETKEETPTKEEELEFEKLTKDSAVVKELFEIFREEDDGTYTITRDFDLSKDNVKKSLAVKQLINENKTSNRTCGSLSAFSENDAYCSMSNPVYNNDTGELDYDKTVAASKNVETTVFNPSDLKAKYLELFGKDAQYSDGSFDLTIYPSGYAYYDKANNLYAHYNSGGGGAVCGATQTLDSIEQSGISLKLFTTLKLEDEDNTIKKITYTFEYEKETGNYIFVSRKEA